MARPERNNIDYFPHPVKHGKKMSYIEKKYKNDGYAVWFKLLEELGDADYHYLNLSDDIQIMFLEERCNISKELLLNIIDDLVKLNEFHTELWVNYRILFNEKFISKIQDAYVKRNNKCITLEGLGILLEGLGILKLSKCNLKGDNKPQTKLKESKVNYIYNQFYDLEIEKSNNDETYLRFVKILFGANDYKRPLDAVLSLHEQLSYKQFSTLLKLKEQFNISIKSILEDMEGWKDLKKNKTVLGTFRTFTKKSYAGKNK